MSEIVNNNYICCKCGKSTTNVLKLTLMKPTSIETQCYTKFNVKVKYTGKKPFQIDHSLCDNCINETRKKVQQKDGLLLILSVVIAGFISLFFRNIFSYFLSGFIILVFFARISDTFSKVEKYWIAYIETQQIYSSYEFNLLNGDKCRSVDYKHKDNFPHLSGGGAVYSKFNDNEYIVFLNNRLSDNDFNSLVNDKSAEVKNMTFIFN